MGEKTCNKCEVVLCDKNIYIVGHNKKNKNYIYPTCKHCTRGVERCMIDYGSPEIHAIVTENNRVLSRKIYVKNNKQFIKDLAKENYSKNHDEYLKNHKKDSDTLSDKYVIHQITRRTSIIAEDVPQELIELKRKQLKLYRYGRQKT